MAEKMGKPGSWRPGFAFPFVAAPSDHGHSAKARAALCLNAIPTSRGVVWWTMF
jgi:hypothetical protein